MTIETTMRRPPARLQISRIEGQILSLLRDHGSRSRTVLSEETGLSPTTITKAVTPLIDKGLVEEHHEPGGRIGRPAIALEMLPDAVAVCGIQIGVGSAQIGIANAFARVKTLQTVEFDPALSALDVLELVASRAKELIDDVLEVPCIAVGVAAPGPVDEAHRRNLLSINLGWDDTPVADILENRLGLPTVVDHNGRALALAESRYGDHSASSIAYVYVRTGVGLGLVLRGEPFEGGRHGVTELGHVRVVDDGLLCSCGAHGCLETVVSEPYLYRRLSTLGVERDPDHTIFTQLEQAQAGSPAVRSLRAEVIRRFAQGIGGMVNLLNPEIIILGGALSDAPSAFLEDLESLTRQEIFPLLRPALTLSRPTLDDAGVSGGAAVALEAALYSGK